MNKIKKIIAEGIGRYPSPGAEQQFITAHKIDILDWEGDEGNAFNFDKGKRQETRPADILPGEDVEKYHGVSDLEKMLAKYPVEDIYDYIERRNSGKVYYQDSRDEKQSTQTSSSPIKLVQDRQLRLRQIQSVYESVSEGNYKLKDGSSVKVSKVDAELIRTMMKELSPKNKTKMQGIMDADKAGFEEILGFAREAL